MKWLKKAFGSRNRERATALVTAGFVHAREGRLDEARRSYDAATDADDTLAVAWLNLGLCELDLFNRDATSLDEEARADVLERAAASLEKALALDDAAFVGWRALARVEERRGSWARADEAWQKVAATAPKDGNVVADANKARKAIARRAAAERARRQALAALEPSASDAERHDALAALLPFLEEEDPDVVRVLGRAAALAGSLARKAGERPLARKLLERAVSEDAADVEALRELASICIEDGDLRRALAASIEAYRERPTDAGLVCNVGVCHLGLGDVEQAAEYIELAHRLEPKDPIVLRAREALAQARIGTTGT